ncbi:hypothetical protein Lal_00017555 [Lupinus albus]|nr:hypothetical protein Lal_00017555 [Lupinus albus]
MSFQFQVLKKKNKKNSVVQFYFSEKKKKEERELKLSLPMKFVIDNNNEELHKVLNAKMDQVNARRLARQAFKDIQLGIDHILFNLLPSVSIVLIKFAHLNSFMLAVLQTPCNGLKVKESFEVNSRGLEIFCKSWLPTASRPKAAVFYCHGYGDTCTFFFEGIARQLVSSGYGVFAMDYPGFGLSEGLHCYIPSFDAIVDDVMEQYSKIKGMGLNTIGGMCTFEIELRNIALTDISVYLYTKAGIKVPDLNFDTPNVLHSYKRFMAENPEFHSLPSFIFGQSMGGAIALKMHFKQPKAWDGAILVAPMYTMQFADDMVPPKFLTQVLIGMANVLPTLKLVPQKDLAEAAFRDLKKREMTAYNVVAYKDKPRVLTAVQMLKTTQEIERRLEESPPMKGDIEITLGSPKREVSLPLLILHGEADTVTDPSVSKALYEKASSSDKKLKLYKDAYHSLLEGEPDEMIIQVLSDIISWLDVHSLKHSSSSS